jgi:hypothetical protein
VRVFRVADILHQVIHFIVHWLCCYLVLLCLSLLGTTELVEVIELRLLLLLVYRRDPLHPSFSHFVLPCFLEDEILRFLKFVLSLLVL